MIFLVDTTDSAFDPSATNIENMVPLGFQWHLHC